MRDSPLWGQCCGEDYCSRTGHRKLLRSRGRTVLFAFMCQCGRARARRAEQGELPSGATVHLLWIMRLCYVLLLAIGLTSCSSSPTQSLSPASVVQAAARPATSPLTKNTGTNVVMHNVLLYENPGPHLQVR